MVYPFELFRWIFIAHDTYERADDDDDDDVSEGAFLTFHKSPDALRNAGFAAPCFNSRHFAVLTFFFFGSAALSSSLPLPPSASAISSSLPLLSCAESYSSATSESESDWKSSSRLSSSSSAEPRSARAATTSSSEELISASLSAA